MLCSMHETMEIDYQKTTRESLKMTPKEDYNHVCKPRLPNKPDI